ncbi:MAG TPA: APC family permease [Gemmatimonadaceae bacterium]|nr:APC family permease [Gemmatimonadaceae bacterium]
MTSEPTSAEDSSASRGMSARDLTLFIMVSVFGLRWVALAAASGPSSLIIWCGAAVLFFVPLTVCVLEMARRYPEEGGFYTWVKRAFGDYPAFVTGWTYWTANLPFFPGLLYFAAGNALLAIPGGSNYSNNGTVIAVMALIGLAIAVIPNVLGIQRGKWVQNAGALGYWIPAAALIGLGFVMFIRHGSATPITSSNVMPEFGLGHALAWSTIAFAFGGVEGVSLVATQVRDPKRSIPRAILSATLIILGLYLLGTLALMWALPASEISSIGGIVQAMDSLGERAGVGGLGRITAVMLAIGGIGGVGAWITATARLPYVAGVDSYLPARFGKLHPRFGTPHVAILTQATLSAILIGVGQAGSSVKAAYELLVAMSLLFTFIPLMLMFASAFRLAGDRTRSAAGLVSPGVLRLMAASGFLVVAVAMFLALVPAQDQPRPVFAVIKLLVMTAVLLGMGTLLFLRGGKKRAIGEAVA